MVEEMSGGDGYCGDRVRGNGGDYSVCNIYTYVYNLLYIIKVMMKLVRIDIPVKIMKRYRQSEKEKECSVRRWWSGSGGVRNHNSGK